MNLNLDIFTQLLSEIFLHLVVKKKAEYMEENLVVRNIISNYSFYVYWSNVGKRTIDRPP